jgi:hypothetical protein
LESQKGIPDAWEKLQPLQHTLITDFAGQLMLLQRAKKMKERAPNQRGTQFFSPKR